MSRVRAKPAVAAITVLVTAPVAFVLFVLGLVVAEYVIIPTATLVTAIFAGLIASWATGTADGSSSEVNAVVVRNLAVAILPAGIAPLVVTMAAPPVLTLIAVVLYTAITGTVLASRHRVSGSSSRRRLVASGIWIAASIAGVIAVVFVASLFGLTGA